MDNIKDVMKTIVQTYNNRIHGTINNSTVGSEGPSIGPSVVIYVSLGPYYNGAVSREGIFHRVFSMAHAVCYV